MSISMLMLCLFLKTNRHDLTNTNTLEICAKSQRMCPK